MLFDLKGKRKRFIQVTYLALAVLFAVGLVGFGVGGGTNGGFIDAITGNGGGGGSQSSSVALKRYERAVQLHPKSETAWLDLIRAEYGVATSGGDYNRATGQFSQGAASQFERSAQAWQRYLALKPKKPDVGAANIMVLIYSNLFSFGSGSPLDQAKRAAEAQQIVAKRQPGANAYFRLAAILYAIGKIDGADRAGKRALALTPKDQRNTVKAQLDDSKKQGLKLKRQVKSAQEQAAKAARDARKKGVDPFGAAPGQSSGQATPGQ
jgi:tetratricopeptide (TPR) repeat protein